LQKQLNKNNKLIPKTLAVFLLISMLTLVFISQVWAEPTISLSIDKTSGYNTPGNTEINGYFTVYASTSSDVERVEFYLDNVLQYNDTNSPFDWHFDTNDYALGQHNITAVAFGTSGQQISASLSTNIVDVPILWTTIVPILLVVGSIALVLLSVWFFRKGYRSNDCPKCGYSAPQQFYFIHFGLRNYLKRCPQCGKFYFCGKSYKPSDNDDSPPKESPSDEDRLRKDIDNSKYEK
jgi:hypothetical protein